MKRNLKILIIINVVIGLTVCVANAQDKSSTSLPLQRENLFDKVLNMYKTDKKGGPQVTPPLRDPFQPQLPVEPVVVKQPPPPTPRPTPKPPRPQPAPPRAQPRPQPTPTAPTTFLPDIEISGIIWNTNRPQAIVNDTVVEIGDSVNNIIIEDITKDGLSVSVGDQYMKIPYRSVSLSATSSKNKSKNQRTLPRPKAKQPKGSGY